VVAPKYVVVRLPEPVNVATFGVDPGATCGDGPTAGTKDFRVETSTATTLPAPADPSWRLAAQGTFTDADQHRLNPVTPGVGSATAVRFVRFTMLSPQVPGVFATTCVTSGASGCSFMDMSELAVFGAPTP
jgi:hypothetical protein